MPRIRKRGKTWSFEIKKTSKSKGYHGSGYRTKKEAERVAKEIELQLASNIEFNIQPEMTLVDLFDSWLKVEILPQNIDDDTKKKYLKRKRWLENYFNDLKISQILRSDYQRFLNKYGERYEINELGRMHANVLKAVEFGKADLLSIDNRFLLNVKLYSQKNPKDIDRKFIHSVDDYNRIVEYLLHFMDYRKTVLHHIMYCMFRTGLRPSEMLALKWKDINFKEQEIYTHCRWSSSKHCIVPAKNEHYYKKLNKRNPSVRYVPFSKEVYQVLMDLKQEQNKILEILNITNDQDFVFYQFESKHPVPDESTVNKALKRVLKKLDIEPLITLYGARHTYGSIKVQEGVPLEVLAKWFGHKDTITLRETYIHLMKERKDEWFEKEKN